MEVRTAVGRQCEPAAFVRRRRARVGRSNSPTPAIRLDYGPTDLEVDDFVGDEHDSQLQNQRKDIEQKKARDENDITLPGFRSVNQRYLYTYPAPKPRLRDRVIRSALRYDPALPVRSDLASWQMDHRLLDSRPHLSALSFCP
jgi:hypothetical protein